MLKCIPETEKMDQGLRGAPTKAMSSTVQRILGFGKNWYIEADPL